MKRALAPIAIAAAVAIAGCGSSQPTVAQRCHNWGVIEASHYPAAVTVKIATQICTENPKVLKQKP